MKEQPRWAKKKDEPGYAKQERDFARKHNLRPSINSGRIGPKGDSFSFRGTDSDIPRFSFDNKQTGAGRYCVGLESWISFSRSAQRDGRRPVLQVEFVGRVAVQGRVAKLKGGSQTDGDVRERGGRSPSIIIMAEEDFFQLKEMAEQCQKQNRKRNTKS